MISKSMDYPLTPKEAYVVARRTGMVLSDWKLGERWKEYGERATLQELGKEMGVTRERIRQIEAKANEKIKCEAKKFLKETINTYTKQ